VDGFVLENIKNGRENLKIKIFMDLFKPILSYVGLGIAHFSLAKTYYFNQSIFTITHCASCIYLSISQNSLAAKKLVSNIFFMSQVDPVSCVRQDFLPEKS